MSPSPVPVPLLWRTTPHGLGHQFSGSSPYQEFVTRPNPWKFYLVLVGPAVPAGCFEHRSRHWQAQPGRVGCESSRSVGPHRDSVANTRPTSSLHAKPEAEKPEFPCAWKQLLKFWSPSPRSPPASTPLCPAEGRHSQRLHRGGSPQCRRLCRGILRRRESVHKVAGAATFSPRSQAQLRLETSPREAPASVLLSPDLLRMIAPWQTWSSDSVLCRRLWACGGDIAALGVSTRR